MDSCVWSWYDSSNREVTGTFSCASSSCAGGLSPHTISTRIATSACGSWECIHTYPTAAAPYAYPSCY